ncbi:hypothetical protein [Glutamicibacter nicotianae]|uniref:hypothetical protein n=1 Tax=Glutamicibacter nicotianae TaxID=37929 RepID=UPI00195C0208|nr:hypothetical protein [Glutamicibacter nicotianae]MBM7767375.1 hypothetical protein [Glutamicibacter nicotianae]
MNFHWFDGRRITGDAIEEAVERCMDTVRGPDRVWNPYAEIMLKAEFKNYLRRAARGTLRPISQVATVGHDPEIPMFEIRWQNVNVTERDPESGELTYSKALVRMYHTEPLVEPDFFIGHHVHEKIILEDPKEISRLQTKEISKAKKIYRDGVNVRWGL